MKFHLDFKPQKADFEINHSHKLFLIGSCFSENIGQLLKDSLFSTNQNPYGILFNPLSIANCLQNCIHLTEPREHYFLNRNDTFYSYQCHSSVNAQSANLLAQELQTLNTTANQCLKTAQLLVITFGSAYYYKHKSCQIAVANCHKQPAQLFSKELLRVDEIVSTFLNLNNELREVNPELKLIFTISPVKHLRDGVIENNLSKATLTVAIHELIKQTENCSYFPAFELVSDDLRDYRFYKEDLAHPNSMAINYVWEKFSETYFSQKTKEINIKLHQLKQSTAHQKNTNNTLEERRHQEFINKLRTELNVLLPGRF